MLAQTTAYKYISSSTPLRVCFYTESCSERCFFFFLESQTGKKIKYFLRFVSRAKKKNYNKTKSTYTQIKQPPPQLRPPYRRRCTVLLAYVHRICVCICVRNLYYFFVFSLARNKKKNTPAFALHGTGRTRIERAMTYNGEEKKILKYYRTRDTHNMRLPTNNKSPGGRRGGGGDRPSGACISIFTGYFLRLATAER